MITKDPRWAFLINKYPERAGEAYELYLRDPKKGKTNPTTYFNFAAKRLYESESRYQRNLKKWQLSQKPIKEMECLI